MKQVYQSLKTGETIVAEVPIPMPQAGEALVRTAVSLVSAGTERMLVGFAEKSLLGKARSRPDLARQVLEKARREGVVTALEAAFNRLDQPMPLGYSSAGTVTALGAGVQGLQVGQRVACAGGNYAVHAEYAAVPKNLLTPLPEAVEFESAAFTTLGAIALHGFRLAEPQLSERIAIIGLGLLGLLAAGIARAAGCHVLGIDLDPRRVELARQIGIEAVLRPEAEEAARSFSRGRGCDSVLICADTSSADPVELAGAIGRDRGKVVAVGAVGLQLPRKVYYEKELVFINSRSYGPGRYDPAYEEGGQDYPIGYVRWTEGRNLEAFVDLLASKKVDVLPLISHRFSIAAAPEAYELITGKKNEPFLGVLLTYPDATVAPERVEQRVVFPPEVSSLTQPGRVAPIRLGILGAGNFAQAVMLPALRKIPAIELVGIVSASGLSARHAADKFGFRYASSDEDELLAEAQINTVAILTRHHLHARQVTAALRAGKHVFCEKPLALSEAELAEILGQLRALSETPQAALPTLMVGFNRRFAPLAVQLQAFIAQRKEPLAAHYRVNAGYIPPNHWIHDPAQGGGRLIGEGCHFIDFLTYLAGAPPVSVSAQVLPDVSSACNDNLVLTLNFPDGSIGMLSYLANGDRAFSKERLEVFAGGRVGVLDDFRSLELVHEGKRQFIASRWRQDKGHRSEWEAFTAAIQSGGPPPIPLDHLIGVTRATFAAMESIRLQERVVLKP